MGHQDYLLKLCYVAALLDGTRGFSVDLLRQKKSTVKQSPLEGGKKEGALLDTWMKKIMIIV